ncbi:DNA polymerase [Motiliproteus sp. SC1-56]|uniref:DNA polymerase n=1 Tax=Motiliproteus sp. SC1-56 TaxID=2799565 RepID=UPI001A8FD296|nr:DNA polymerase [Motiliproteus sp. SC1-56]
MSAVDKEEVRALAKRGGPYGDVEKSTLLDHCASQADAISRLLQRMVAEIDIPRALLRGRYMSALTQVEMAGVPINTDLLQLLRDHWEGLRPYLIDKVNPQYEVFQNGRFDSGRFSCYLKDQGIDWPRTPTGCLKVDGDTFSDMAKAYPQLRPLKELLKVLGKLRLEKLHVGPDGRCRTSLRPLMTVTSRNAPSTNRFPFGLAKPFRALIRPEDGHGLGYVDYQQQEFGIAASLSGDLAMQEAYRSGDPYLAFAKQAGAVPEEATKHSHSNQRSLFKATVLGVQYGMGVESLARQIGCTLIEAEALLEQHRHVYHRFWGWLENVEHHALETGQLQTVYGWRMRVSAKTKPRTIMNWPMQAHGAEMLRIATILCVEAGIKVIAPVHDALVVEARLDRLSDTVRLTQQLMKEASCDVLPGFPLRTDAEQIESPNHFPTDGDGELWALMIRYLEQQQDTNHDSN